MVKQGGHDPANVCAGMTDTSPRNYQAVSGTGILLRSFCDNVEKLYPEM